jgi:hypothetical protein
VKGDKVEVIYQVGEKAITHVVEAERNGQTVDIREPKGQARMYDFAVVGKTGKDAAVHSFAKDNVIAIIDHRSATET